MFALWCYILLHPPRSLLGPANGLHYLTRHSFLLLSWLKPDGPQSDGGEREKPWWSREVGRRRQMWWELKEENVLPLPHIIFHIGPICCPPHALFTCNLPRSIYCILPLSALHCCQRETKVGEGMRLLHKRICEGFFADIVFHPVNLGVTLH